MPPADLNLVCAALGWDGSPSNESTTSTGMRELQLNFILTNVVGASSSDESAVLDVFAMFGNGPGGLKNAVFRVVTFVGR